MYCSNLVRMITLTNYRVNYTVVQFAFTWHFLLSVMLNTLTVNTAIDPSTSRARNRPLSTLVLRL